MKKLITITQASEALGVTRDTVRRWAKSGRLRSRKKKRPSGGYTFSIYRDSVIEKGGKFDVPTPTKPSNIVPLPTSERELKASRHKARNVQSAAVHAQESQIGRTINDWPELSENQKKLRTKLEGSLLDFLLHTFQPIFRNPLSGVHYETIADVEKTLKSGGNKLLCVPRGFGKTSILECASIWAILNGLRRFVVIVAAEQTHADSSILSIKTEFETNEKIEELWPEVSRPIIALEGINARARGQLAPERFGGGRTRITWSGSKIVFPTLPGSVSSGSVIMGAGITSARLRGLKHKNPAGENVRPDQVLIDDPQDQTSARSPIQVRSRIDIIDSSIGGLAGPDVELATFCLATIIEQNDVPSNLKELEEWHAVVRGALKSMPSENAMKLWAKWNRLRKKSLKAGTGLRLCNDFYLENKEKMNEGAEVTWDHYKKPKDVDALSYAMRMYFEKERAFWSEVMNQPVPSMKLSDDQLSPENVYARTVGLARGEVPPDAVELVAFVDVHANLLYYVVMACAENFTPHVVEYGTFPEQNETYYTQASARNTLSGQAGKGLEGVVYGALETLTYSLLSREFERYGGGHVRISRLHIDAGWLDDVIYLFVRQSPFSSVMLPSHGKFIGAKANPMSAWKKFPGEKAGLNWIRTRRGKHGQRHIVTDVNAWKEFMFNRLCTSKGNPGCMTFYGGTKKHHQMLADHVCSEYRVKVEATRTVYEWSQKPNTDNHYLDCIVGCLVAASYQGCILSQDVQEREEERAKEIQAKVEEQRSRLRSEVTPATGRPLMRPPKKKRSKSKSRGSFVARVKKRRAGV